MNGSLTVTGRVLSVQWWVSVEYHIHVKMFLFEKKITQQWFNFVLYSRILQKEILRPVLCRAYKINLRV